MRIIGCFIVVAFILVSSVSLTCAQEQGEEYSFFSVRRKLKALDAKLKVIEKAPPSFHASPYGPGDYERVIEAGGRSRRYSMHIPLAYTKNQPWPIVINYHGGGGRAATARLQSGMDEKADSAGFIVVYPDGTGLLGKRLLTWNAGDCCGYAMKNNEDDVLFTRVLLDDIEKLFRIDPNKIYVTGLSNGALMAYRVACELSDRIAAAASIAGAVGVDDCKPKRHVSIIHFHGTGDPCVPYHGGVGKESISKTNFKSVKQTIGWWLQRNEIPSKPVKTEKKGHATIVFYRGSDDTEFVLVTLEGMGHTWPGGRRVAPENKVGLISRNISVNDMMWDFFQRHPLKRTANKPNTNK